jgi:hypothetical protein
MSLNIYTIFILYLCNTVLCDKLYCKQQTAFLVCGSLQNGLILVNIYEITWSYILDAIIMYWEVHYSKGNDLSYRITMHDILVMSCISCINCCYVAKFFYPDKLEKSYWIQIHQQYRQSPSC